MNSTCGVYYIMGTLMRIRVGGDMALKALENLKLRCIQEIQRLENLLSLYRSQSEVSLINADAGSAPVKVSAETFRAVEQAIYYAHLTKGACDPTIYPLLRLWGVYRMRGVVPDAQALEWTLERVGYEKAELDPRERSIFLREKGMGLDLGWIGKGFALDHARQIAQDEPGVFEIMMDFGGQLLFWNRHKPVPQSVLIDVPGLCSKHLPRVTFSGNGSVSSTSNAERTTLLYDPLTAATTRMGHILDPRSGTPMEHMRLVSVAARTATESDALSTALFVLRVEEGIQCLKNVPGAHAIFFKKDSRAEPSPGLTSEFGIIKTP